MSSWQAVSRTGHSTKYWKTRNGFEHYSSEHLVPVLMAELTKLVPHYTLAFTESEGVYTPVAILGLGGKVNSYVTKNGRWLGKYVPAEARKYPFSLLTNSNGDKVFCVEESHVSETTTDMPFFDSEGNMSDSTANIFQFLSKCEAERIKTLNASKVLAETGIIVPWEFQVVHEQGAEPKSVGGVFRIDQDAFKGLSDEQVLTLRACGALDMAYAQVFSSEQLYQIAQRQAYLQRDAAAAQSPMRFDEILSANDDDSLNFDAFD